MRHVRQSNKPITPPTPATRRRRWVWVAGAGAVVVLAVGAWLYARERPRAADRTAALAAAADQGPDAGEQLKACLARDPNDVEVVETLVVWSLRSGVPFAQVEPHLDRLCELKPADPAPWRTRASQRIRNGRPAEGIADGLRALELDPSDDATRKLVAAAALEAGDHAVAARELERLLESSPRPPDEIASMLVRAHLQAGDAGAPNRSSTATSPRREPTPRAGSSAGSSARRPAGTRRPPPPSGPRPTSRRSTAPARSSPSPAPCRRPAATTTPERRSTNSTPCRRGSGRSWTPISSRTT